MTFFRHSDLARILENVEVGIVVDTVDFKRLGPSKGSVEVQR